MPTQQKRKKQPRSENQNAPSSGEPASSSAMSAGEVCARHSGSASVWLEAARPKTLPAAIAPVLVGTALAYHDDRFDWRAAALCAAFSLLMQIGANFANDYYDFVKGSDTSARLGPRRAVASGLVAPAIMQRAMWLVFAVGFALGLLLIAWGGWWLVAIGVLSVLCAIAYTGGPYPLAYHGLGDVFVFIFFGPVAVGATYYVQAGALSVWALALSVPLGLLAANILILNNYRDMDEDRLVGKRTTVVRFGKRYARMQFGAALWLSFALPVAAVLLAGWSACLLLPLALLPMALHQQWQLRASRTPQQLIVQLGASGRFLGLYAVLLAAGVFCSSYS